MWTLFLALAFASDADLDGLTDEQELALGTRPDMVDTDQDGLPDGLEVGDSDTAPDFDQDGLIDALDDDDDNDTLPTLLEIGPFDWTVPYSEPRNSDGQGLPDYLDLDADNDGDPDQVEGTEDRDCDGVPNWIDADDASHTCDTGVQTTTTSSTATTTTRDAPPADETPPSEHAATPSGCQCGAGATSTAWWIALPLCLGIRRRRETRRGN